MAASGQISPAYRWLYARITYYKMENLFPGEFSKPSKYNDLDFGPHVA
jgi:hypothetical protein